MMQQQIIAQDIYNQRLARKKKRIRYIEYSKKYSVTLRYKPKGIHKEYIKMDP